MRDAPRGKPTVRETKFPKGTRVVCVYGRRCARVGTSQGIYIYSGDDRISVLWDGDEASDIVLESIVVRHDADPEGAS